MALFNINPRCLRSVRRAIQSAAFIGPWEIMPVQPGSSAQQIWIQDDIDAIRLRFAVRWSALQPVRKAV